MDIEVIARNALKILADAERRFGYRKREIAALTGFFKGVAEGIITTGQDWPVRLLLLERTTQANETLIANNLTEIEYKTLEEIFASGMCCAGQPLNGKRAKAFGSRPQTSNER